MLCGEAQRVRQVSARSTSGFPRSPQCLRRDDQAMVIGPNSTPMTEAALPRRNEPITTPDRDRPRRLERRGADFRPSTADNTEIAGVSTASP